MSLSSRRFLIAQDGSLYRLANTLFDRMLRDPDAHVLPVFAGQRVRMADLVVELDSRAPVRVLRRTFAMLSFDDKGRIDSGRFVKQQWALAESALDPAFDVSDREQTVLDAAARFIAQGGTWHPSAAMASAVDAAALGRIACRRL